MSAIRYSDYRTGKITYDPLPDPDPVWDGGAGPVEVRYLTPDELAAIRALDAPAPAPRIRKVTGVLSQTEIDRRRTQQKAEAAARTEARRIAARDAKRAEREAIRASRQPRDARGGAASMRKVEDAAVIDALRATHGNRQAASRLVGVANPTLCQRVEVMRRYGLLPADVDGMLTYRRRAA
jgi:DNA-binding NtrC family response regulator